MIVKRPATVRGRLQAALAALMATGMSADSHAFTSVQRQYAGRHGKHNGRTNGAFGSSRQSNQ